MLDDLGSVERLSRDLRTSAQTLSDVEARYLRYYGANATSNRWRTRRLRGSPHETGG